MRVKCPSGWMPRARELDDAAPSPRWTRIRDTAAQADALAVEDADEPADDPFAGGEDA